MSDIATKNGDVIVKDGSVAENCQCCGGGACQCVAPQQMQIEFNGNESGLLAQVVLTQSAYAAAFGRQITDLTMGTFDANSPYPNEQYYGVAGYSYAFVFEDPTLGAAPSVSALQGNCLWANKNDNRLRVYSWLEIMRRGGTLSASDATCFFLRWTYSQVGVNSSCNLVGWGASSGWSVLPGGAGNNPYIMANFTQKSFSACCIEPIYRYVGRHIGVNGVADFQGSGGMTVLDCA
mgnify:CR=1 FL=1